ncbi:linear amide C-N hydrolase [Synechococcus sp. CCY9202]|uniref:linear amide C-N hydrolase n=1 Tax=Synechococcus sp. CCY9202 TaxID=174698 RepID=UPI002B1FD033|nr:linear amide C-N hydrolase [Synechococcus sp. CCY9202]MEA5424536.1 linear amide C-N hydrolase [Synechococcus sp. CCY9202]
MTDNPTGEYTNNPPVAYHLATAGNDANLRASPPAEMNVNGLLMPPVSSGGGMHGLPGDFLSASRLIRALLFSRSAPTNLTTLTTIQTCAVSTLINSPATVARSK